MCALEPLSRARSSHSSPTAVQRPCVFGKLASSADRYEVKQLAICEKGMITAHRVLSGSGAKLCASIATRSRPKIGPPVWRRPQASRACMRSSGRALPMRRDQLQQMRVYFRAHGYGASAERRSARRSCLRTGFRGSAYRADENYAVRVTLERSGTTAADGDAISMRYADESSSAWRRSAS